LYFFLHACLHSFEHRAATSQHNASKQVLPNVFLAFDDGVVSVLVDAILVVLHLLSPVRWLEQNLGALECLPVHCDSLRAWQLVLLRRRGLITRSLQLSIEIVSNLSMQVLNLDGCLVSLLFLFIGSKGQVLGVSFVQQED